MLSIKGKGKKSIIFYHSFSLPYEANSPLYTSIFSAMQYFGTPDFFSVNPLKCSLLYNWVPKLKLNYITKRVKLKGALIKKYKKQSVGKTE